MKKPKVWNKETTSNSTWVPGKAFLHMEPALPQCIWHAICNWIWSLQGWTWCRSHLRDSCNKPITLKQEKKEQFCACSFLGSCEDDIYIGFWLSLAWKEDWKEEKNMWNVMIVDWYEEEANIDYPFGFGLCCLFWKLRQRMFKEHELVLWGNIVVLCFIPSQMHTLLLSKFSNLHVVYHIWGFSVYIIQHQIK